ncbi:MAG: SDR family oxidoreductase [Candidatus Eremiobacteraeota bacterium]|nr:SDR family oxidoreductase [Candidatus Eremiobacteraeota bacterium]
MAPESKLLGKTVVVVGGSSGIGMETARQARAAGAQVILTARNRERLDRAAQELQAKYTAAFDATDLGDLENFFTGLPEPVDHIMVTAGAPAYVPLSSMKLDDARKAFDQRLAVTVGTALFTRGKVRPGGSLLFVGGTGARRPGVGLTIATTLTNALPALVANLALELAPTRVNIVAPGFVDTPLSESLLGAQIDARRDELRAKLPIHRVVGPEDVAALAVHIMSNDALTGSTYDVDGGQHLLPG